jgi:outer membrane protein assembly factor BamB
MRCFAPLFIWILLSSSSSAFIIDSLAIQPALVPNLRGEEELSGNSLDIRELQNSNIYDIGPTENNRLWSIQLMSGIESKPVITLNGTVLIGCLNGRIYALDNLNGNTIWASDNLGAYIRSSPVLSEDERYIYLTALSSTSSSVAVVYGISTFSGEIYFSKQIVQIGGTATTVAGRPELFNASSIMVVALGDTIYSIQLLYLRDTLNNSVIRSPGDVLWQYRVPSSKLLSSASILDSQVFITTANRRDVVCLDANTGAECWREALGFYSSSTPRIDAQNRMIYVVSQGGVHGIQISENCNSSVSQFPSERTKWIYYASMPLTSAAYQNSRLFIGTQANTIVALNLERGLSPMLRWEYSMNGSLKLSSPVIDINDRVYVSTDTGTVFSFNGSYDSQTGTSPVLWSLTPTPRLPIYASPVLGPNNTLLVANSAGRVLSLGGFSAISPPVSSPTGPDVSDAHNGLSGGAIAGISIACILVCAGIAIALFTLSRKKTSEANTRDRVTAEDENSDSNSASAHGSEMLTMPEPGTQCSDIEASEDEETDDISNNAAYRAYLSEFNKQFVSIQGQVPRKGRRRNRTRRDNSDLQYFLTEASIRNATRGTESDNDLSNAERENGEVSEITSPIFSEDETFDTCRGTCDEGERASIPIIESGESMLTPERRLLSKREIKPKRNQETALESESEAEQPEFPVPTLKLRMPIERTRARTFVFDNLSDVSLEKPNDLTSTRRSKSQSELSKEPEPPQPALLVTPKYAPPPVPSKLETSRLQGILQHGDKALGGGTQGMDRREPHSETLQPPGQSKSLALTGNKKRVATFNTAMSLRTEKSKDAKET